MTDPQNTPPTAGLHEENAVWQKWADQVHLHQQTNNATSVAIEEVVKLSAALARTDERVRWLEAESDWLRRENEELRKLIVSHPTLHADLASPIAQWVTRANAALTRKEE